MRRAQKRWRLCRARGARDEKQKMLERTVDGARASKDVYRYASTLMRVTSAALVPRLMMRLPGEYIAVRVRCQKQ